LHAGCVITRESKGKATHSAGSGKITGQGAVAGRQEQQQRGYMVIFICI